MVTSVVESSESVARISAHGLAVPVPWAQRHDTQAAVQFCSCLQEIACVYIVWKHNVSGDMLMSCTTTPGEGRSRTRKCHMREPQRTTDRSKKRTHLTHNGLVTNSSTKQYKHFKEHHQKLHTAKKHHSCSNSLSGKMPEGNPTWRLCWWNALPRKFEDCPEFHSSKVAASEALILMTRFKVCDSIN